MDFSNWLTGNVSDEQKITELQTFPLQIQSPAQAGLNLKRRSNGARESDRQSLKLWMADGICPIASTKVKRKRAQGECLGIRSR